MTMLGWMTDKILTDMIRNDIHGKLEMVSVEDKTEANWFTNQDHDKLQLQELLKLGQAKRSWIGAIKKDMALTNVSEKRPLAELNGRK